MRNDQQMICFGIDGTVFVKMAIMKKYIYNLVFLFLSPAAFAQNTAVDTIKPQKVTITKDPRLDILAKVEADFNAMSTRFTKGYRLFVLKSDNRDYAMKVRAYLLQSFPEEKVIMTYQSPFIKMKFGDFVEKKDAERYRDMIMKGKVVIGNVYVVPETIELKPDKFKEGEFK
ncbi:MAG: hypothetical protein ABI666_10325 [Ferruginibacter sp.]